MFEVASEKESPRERRRAATRQEILDAAWDLAQREGLAGISLRELGRRVGLKASSLYAYFDSKGALYDAMFREGYEQLLEWSERWPGDMEVAADPHRAFVDVNREFFQLCIDEPVRYQLLFQRTLPGWEPSAESYELALVYLGKLRSSLTSLGVADERAVDMWTAVLTGLTSQQLSNDPGGDRYLALLDDAVDMFFRQFPPRPPGTTPDRDPTPVSPIRTTEAPS